MQPNQVWKKNWSRPRNTEEKPVKLGNQNHKNPKFQVKLDETKFNWSKSKKVHRSREKREKPNKTQKNPVKPSNQNHKNHKTQVKPDETRSNPSKSKKNPSRQKAKRKTR